MEKCANCEIPIGNLEAAYIFEEQSVCGICIKKLLYRNDWKSPSTIRSLGLTSLAQARTLIIVGAIFMAAILGIPIFLWGAIAEQQMRAELLRQGKRTMSVTLVAVLIIISATAFFFGGIGLISYRMNQMIYDASSKNGDK